MTENSKETSNQDRFESFDDIVFSERNREYGAYYLRKRYKRFAIIAFSIAFIMFGTAIAVPYLEALSNRNKLKKLMEKSLTMEMENIKNEEAPPPPPPPPPPAAIEAQVKFRAPVVVDTVKEEVTIATVDDVKATTNEAPPEEIVVEEKKDEVMAVEEPTFIIVQENATFQGGDINSFRLWVQQNMVYPTAAAEAGISGKVIVQFAVNSKGNIVDAKILRGVHPELDKEAIRCIISSPHWVPGKQGGKAVKQQFVIPIVFQLQ
jgi:periplasmic protein TonB